MHCANSQKSSQITKATHRDDRKFLKIGVTAELGSGLNVCTCMVARGKGEGSNVCDISSMPNMLKLVENADKVLVF